MKNEFDALFTDTESRTSAVTHHQERIDWLRKHLPDVREHLPDVLIEFGLEPSEAESWTIEPILVLDSDLLSRYLVEPPFKVMAEDEFMRFLDSRQ